MTRDPASVGGGGGVAGVTGPSAASLPERDRTSVEGTLSRVAPPVLPLTQSVYPRWRSRHRAPSWLAYRATHPGGATKLGERGSSPPAIPGHHPAGVCDFGSPGGGWGGEKPHGRPRGRRRPAGLIGRENQRCACVAVTRPPSLPLLYFLPHRHGLDAGTHPGRAARRLLIGPPLKTLRTRFELSGG
jgi:hypothetical protein